MGRHPLYAGFFMAFWAAPEMTAGHLLLAVGVSVYMLIAIRYEERDLTDLFGEDYRSYRAEVGRLMPRFRRRDLIRSRGEAERRADVALANWRCGPAGAGQTGCRRASLAADSRLDP